MSPQLAHMVLRLACFLTITTLFLLYFIPSGTAEFVVTVITLGVGLIFLLVAILCIRRL